MLITHPRLRRSEIMFSAILTSLLNSPALFMISRLLSFQMCPLLVFILFLFLFSVCNFIHLLLAPPSKQSV
jgi:hypothetical protein